MNDMDTKVRETLASVGTATPVPMFDEVAFRRKVRGARLRSSGVIAAGVAVAAGIVAAALVAVPSVLGSDPVEAPDLATAGPAVDPSVLPSPLYYIAGMRLMALTPDGEVHELGSSEAIVGATADGVYAYDAESRVVRFDAATSGEGDGRYTFIRGDAPVTEAVQSAALSGDGRYLAWVDLQDVVTVHDLKADAEIRQTQLAENSAVTAVSDRGVLVSENGELKLLEDDGILDVPTAQDGYGALSDLAGDFVSVGDRDDVTRVYDVTKGVPDDHTNGTAVLVDSVPGTGRLAPYAGGIVSVARGQARLFAGGEPRALTGIAGTPQSAGWIDEDHVVVASAESPGTSLYVCAVEELTCTRVAFSETDLRLAE